MDINIRIAGEAGQGIETAGEILTRALAAMGFYVFATKNYMSRIRGGLNWYNVRFADRQLFSGRREADILLCLTAEGVEYLKQHLNKNGVLISDEESGKESECACLPLGETAKKNGGAKVMLNMTAAGAVFGLLPYDIDFLHKEIKSAFKGKGDEAVEKNLACARAGAKLVEELPLKLQFPEPAKAETTICSGTEATALGAAVAGVKFAAAYPMTPATGVITWLAQHARDYRIVVEQAEDEIAAINMILGASYAGVPALTATSGGGFALMTEGVSLAGMLELPALIILSQRPGPATGLPTRTAQQDLRFAIHAGHGEFPRAVFTPGTPEEAFSLTRKALEISHKYQTPVIVMLDQFLADLVRNTEPLPSDCQPIDRCLEFSPGRDYKRYKLTENGVSPRALPGGEALVKLDSDEHDEEGHITENFDTRISQQDKRMKKENGILLEWIEPERYGAEDAKNVFLTWGSTYGPCREAVDVINSVSERKVAMVHFPQVWPINVSKAKAVIKGKSTKWPRLICVEANATAQLAGVLKEKGVINAYETALKYNGVPFWPEEIVKCFNKTLI